MSRIQQLIQDLHLKRHPEGGHFRETYRSAEILEGDSLNGRFPGRRNICTSIYYLLSQGERSMLHRIRSDELWYFHEGDRLDIVIIDSNGLTTLRLGRDLANGERLQLVVPAGSWFGALLPAESEYVLCSCTVAPGFDFDDFELGNRDTLLGEFPLFRDEILRLTNP